jgi:hypothetical protein
MKYTKQELSDFFKQIQKEVDANLLTEESAKKFEEITRYFNLLDPNIESVEFKEQK